MTSTDEDVVNHPSHYQMAGGIEVIDVIESAGLGYRLGNVIKYVLRADHKYHPIEDLEKAAWYLQREIAKRKERQHQAYREVVEATNRAMQESEDADFWRPIEHVPDFSEDGELK